MGKLSYSKFLQEVRCPIFEQFDLEIGMNVDNSGKRWEVSDRSEHTVLDFLQITHYSLRRAR